MVMNINCNSYILIMVLWLSPWHRYERFILKWNRRSIPIHFKVVYHQYTKTHANTDSLINFAKFLLLWSLSRPELWSPCYGLKKQCWIFYMMAACMCFVIFVADEQGNTLTSTDVSMSEWVNISKEWVCLTIEGFIVFFCLKVMKTLGGSPHDSYFQVLVRGTKIMYTVFTEYLRRVLYMRA